MQVLRTRKNRSDLGTIPPTPLSYARSGLSLAGIDWEEASGHQHRSMTMPRIVFSNLLLFHDTGAKHIPANTSALQGIPDASSKQTHVTV